MKFKKSEPSNIYKLRKKYLLKNIDLINITTLCEPKLGYSGWCNGFNEPDESIHHIQLWYRNDQVATLNGDGGYVIDDKNYLFYITNKDDLTGADFIIFRKVKKTLEE